MKIVPQDKSAVDLLAEHAHCAAWKRIAMRMSRKVKHLREALAREMARNIAREIKDEEHASLQLRVARDKRAIKALLWLTCHDTKLRVVEIPPQRMPWVYLKEDVHPNDELSAIVSYLTWPANGNVTELEPGDRVYYDMNNIPRVIVRVTGEVIAR